MKNPTSTSAEKKLGSIGTLVFLLNAYIEIEKTKEARLAHKDPIDEGSVESIAIKDLEAVQANIAKLFALNKNKKAEELRGINNLALSDTGHVSAQKVVALKIDATSATTVYSQVLGTISSSVEKTKSKISFFGNWPMHTELNKLSSTLNNFKENLPSDEVLLASTKNPEEDKKKKDAEDTFNSKKTDLLNRVNNLSNPEENKNLLGRINNVKFSNGDSDPFSSAEAEVALLEKKESAFINKKIGLINKASSSDLEKSKALLEKISKIKFSNNDNDSDPLSEIEKEMALLDAQENNFKNKKADLLKKTKLLGDAAKGLRQQITDIKFSSSVSDPFADLEDELATLEAKSNFDDAIQDLVDKLDILKTNASEEKIRKIDILLNAVNSVKFTNKKSAESKLKSLLTQVENLEKEPAASQNDDFVKAMREQNALLKQSLESNEKKIALLENENSKQLAVIGPYKMLEQLVAQKKITITVNADQNDRNDDFINLLPLALQDKLVKQLNTQWKEEESSSPEESPFAQLNKKYQPIYDFEKSEIDPNGRDRWQYDLWKVGCATSTRAYIAVMKLLEYRDLPKGTTGGAQIQDNAYGNTIAIHLVFLILTNDTQDWSALIAMLQDELNTAKTKTSFAVSALEDTLLAISNLTAANRNPAIASDPSKRAIMLGKLFLANSGSTLLFGDEPNSLLLNQMKSYASYWTAQAKNDSAELPKMPSPSPKR